MRYKISRSVSRPVTSGTNSSIFGQAPELLEREDVGETLDLFASLFQHEPFGMAVVNTAGRMVAVNPVWCGMLGYSREELIGLHFADITHPADLQNNLSLFEQTVDGKRDSYSIMKRYITKTGSIIWGRLTVAIAKDKRGEPLYCISHIQDMTQSVQREQELRHYQALVQHSGVAIYSYDLNGIIQTWNQGSEELFGYNACEIVGQPISRLVPIELHHIVGKYLTLINAGKAWRSDEVRRRRDGSRVHVALAISPIRDEHGRVIGGSSIAHDITEFQAMQDELSKTDRLHLVGELAASISHEIRNPMTTVRGYMQILSKKPELKEYASQMELVIGEIDQVTEIINEFLALTNIHETKLECADLNGILQTLYPLIEAEGLLQRKDIELEQGDIPPIYLDTRETRQLILNMVRNGFDAMDPFGLLEVKTYLQDGRVVLEISDEGKGIPEQYLPTLGKTFFTTKQGGIGLGLPICYRIAERHRAHISVDTGADGTTFKVSYPLSPYEMASS